MIIQRKRNEDNKDGSEVSVTWKSRTHEFEVPKRLLWMGLLRGNVSTRF